MTDNTEPDTPAKAVHLLETELGLPQGFFDTLAKEDDWSFVIKLHALFESALSFVVGHRLGGEVAGLIARLDMNGTKGKVAFARALDFVTDEEVRFLELLSKLRNRCAHGIRQAVEFSLPGHVASLTREERKNFQRAICGDEADKPITIGAHTTTRGQFVLENPKIEIWLCSMYVLAGLYMLKEIAEITRRTERSIIEDSLWRTPPPSNSLLIAMAKLPDDSHGA
jgi:hypothetical protein